MPIVNNSKTRGRVVGGFVLNLIETAAQMNVGTADLARAAGLQVDTLETLPETVSVRDYLNLLESGARLTCDPLFGLHVGERINFSAHAVYGMILLSCTTFAEAILQVIRYECLAHDLGRTSIRFDGEEVVLSWQSPWPEGRQCHHLGESIVASFRTLAEWLARKPLPIIEVGFAHAPRASLSDYERVLRCPVTFNRDTNFGRFSVDLLGWTLPYANPALFPVLVQHGEQLLRGRTLTHETSEIEMRVKDAIILNLGKGRVALDEIATDMGMSMRTLQRRLQAAGIRYRSLLDSTRDELAQHYLRDTQIPITEIAFLVGFQEQSSFTHAFRSWTGMSPGSWRLANAGQ